MVIGDVDLLVNEFPPGSFDSYLSSEYGMEFRAQSKNPPTSEQWSHRNVRAAALRQNPHHSATKTPPSRRQIVTLVSLLSNRAITQGLLTGNETQASWR
jgi:hypothetical protein